VEDAYLDDERLERELVESGQRQRQARRQRRADLRTVMSTEAGRRLFYRLINDDSGLCVASFMGESTHETAHREGRRALAIELQNELLRDCPLLYLHMMQERLEALPNVPDDELDREE